MKILVTGGAGFIGSNFIRHILNKYPTYRIVNLDKLTYCGNLGNLNDLKDNNQYRFVHGDICDEKLVGRLVKGTQAVVNFAASTHVDRSIKNPSEFIDTNIRGTFVLLEASRKHKIQKYLQVSTDEVYGSCPKGSFCEDSQLSPNSPYAASKAAADHLTRAYFVTYNLPVLITRSSNNFGPYQYPEKAIPLFITNALELKKLPLYGDGLNVRDWLFVYDNCLAIDLVLHQGKIGEVYNIGAGNEKPNVEIIKLILKKLGKPEKLIKYVVDRPGHDRRYSIETDKIKGLGWSQKYSFEQALDLTINWYKANKNWWKRLKKS